MFYSISHKLNFESNKLCCRVAGLAPSTVVTKLANIPETGRLVELEEAIGQVCSIVIAHRLPTVASGILQLAGGLLQSCDMFREAVKS